VCNGYEELGILVKNGIVDKDLFLDRYSWVITGVWRATDKAVADARQDTGQAAIWENFEYLAVLSKELDSKPSERLSERYGEDALTRAAAAEKPLKASKGGFRSSEPEPAAPMQQTKRIHGWWWWADARLIRHVSARV